MDFDKNIIDFSGLSIRLSSSKKIREWSKGEVLKPETINYRTLKSEKDGLFCEKIFGPTKDWECYCGKYKRIRYRGVICDKCGVEVTQSRVRRERMGHIELAAPAVHIWYFKGAPSKISLLLNLPPRGVEAIVYFAKYLVVSVDETKKAARLEQLEKDLVTKKAELKGDLDKQIEEAKKKAKKEEIGLKKTIKNKERQTLALDELKLKIKQNIQNSRDKNLEELVALDEIYKTITSLAKSVVPISILTEDDFLKLAKYDADDFLKVKMGAEAILDAIKTLDLGKMASELKEESKKAKAAKNIKIIKRLQVVEGFRRSKIDPSWMIMDVVPVIPPDLRPMVQLSGGRFATSDLNDLYRRVINRNNRLKHLVDLGAPEIILRNEKRMLQEAVDSLIDASKHAVGRTRGQRKPLRSLSDMLRGKQGRFRQNLLGKRVDYSGRSVIVVGPELSLDQCGLPKEMALEMFKPFVLREIISRGIAPNVRSAKNILEQKPAEIFDILEEITHNHPVLLNRAPTLHKLGIQAFYPVLIEGESIKLHPCACSGYNADFDGDQMAVHIPLGEKSKEECSNQMMPKQNLLKPSDGTLSVTPNKEMAMGCFFITAVNSEIEESKIIFSDEREAILAHQLEKINIRQLIRIRLNGKIIKTTVGRLLFNQVLPEGIDFLNDAVKESTIRDLISRAMQIVDNEETVKLIDSIKTIGFWGASLSGISVGVWDCLATDGKEEIIAEANQKASQVEENFANGLITTIEKRRLSQEIWMETAEHLVDKTWEEFTPENSVKLIIDAKVGRASKEQVKQLSAMQGLVTDPMGKIVELPVKSNFREGLSAFEYVNSARGSRKGLTDTAIKTADAGYLTRRLVDVTHDALIREEDCDTKEGILIEANGRRAEKFAVRILGRTLAAEIIDPKTKKVLLKRGEVVDESSLELIKKHNVSEVEVRSPLTCKTSHGICRACYGWDFSTKEMVDLGAPVGVLSAQSIGEPGTQLTMRTKHFGGIIVSDVTQGLPRVEELFEARIPKSLSPIAEIAGKVSIDEKDDIYAIKINSVGIKPADEREYVVPAVSNLLVEDKQLVDAGTQLASGSLDVREVLNIRGLKKAQEYLIEELQIVYESQGIPINDRHFEVIVRKMSDKVKVEKAGDTDLLPGEFVTRYRFENENKKTLAEGGEPASAQVVILGITKSSICTDSWLSAASFEQTTSVLTNSASEGKVDNLIGLKENVIIGRLIPTTAQKAKLED